MDKRIRLRVIFCLLALLLLPAGSGTVVSAAGTKAAGKQLKGAAKKKKNAAEAKALQALIKKQKKKPFQTILHTPSQSLLDGRFYPSYIPSCHLYWN